MQRNALVTLTTFITLTLLPTGPAWAGDKKPRRVQSYAVFHDDLDTGTATTSKHATYVRSFGCFDDQAGHIVANRLGGEAKESNLFPQNETVNTGQFRVEEISEALNKDKESRSCKRFDNPMSRQCEKDDGTWDRLVEEATKHMRSQKHLRDPEKFLRKKGIKAVRGADIETNKDDAARAAQKVIDTRQRQIDDEWDDVRDAYDELHIRFKQYEKNGERKKDATDWIKRLKKDKKAVAKAVAQKLKGNGSKRDDATIAHNIKQHEAMQNKMDCDLENDGYTDKPDCVVYKTCTVWEFYPDASKDKSKHRKTATTNAEKLNDKLEKDNNSKWAKCFADDGPTDGEGFEGKAASYRAHK